MDITTELVDIVERAHSLRRILDEAAPVVAARWGVESCVVFLLDARGALIREGSSAPSRSGDAPVGVDAELVALRVIRDHHVARAQTPTTSLLAVPLLLRDTTLGAMVLVGAREREFSETEGAELEATAAHLAGIVANARIIDALDRGEPPKQLTDPGAFRHEEGDGSDESEIGLRGVGASPGVAIGRAVFRGTHRIELGTPKRSASDPPKERERVRTALDKTRNDLLRIQEAAAREIDEEHALIFAYHLLLLGDPTLLARIDEEVTNGLDAAWAMSLVLDEFEARLRLAPDAYIRERADDIDDLRGRLLDHALGREDRERFGARIVLTQRIPPSLVVELKTEGARALVTQLGGETSHGVLLARAVGIPTVTGLADVLDTVKPDDQLVVDGSTGVVIVRPSAETLSSYSELRLQAEHARTQYAKFRDVLAVTKDGARITLHANIGVASDITAARENGAEGIGLYRTELPFIVRDAFPTLRQQVRIYGKAYEAFPDGPIHFRILDLGGDKFVAGGSIATARSAFHGYRSIRVLFDHPHVLREQVQAFSLAAGERPLRILIPMVASIEELRRVKALIVESLDAVSASVSAQRTAEIGAMIEVPAAVELAGDIAREVDFLSIGTNDLMQYTLVVDREDSRMAQLNDPYHPAILRMIRRVAQAAREAGKPVGVCGAIAARPDIALALVALGIDSLSVVPGVIPELKQALASARLEAMRAVLPDVLALSDARSIAGALRTAFSA